MPIHILAAAAALALSLPVLVVALTAGRGDTGASARSAAAADLHKMSLDGTAGDRLLKPAASAIANWARALLPARAVDRLERKIVLAGATRRWTVERVLTIKLVGGVGALVGAYVLLDSLAPGTRLAATLFAGVTAFFAPDILFGGRAKDRQTTIQHELPDALDQMTMSVEAGLGFEAAVGRVAKAGDGPLAEELTFALQEMQIGVSRHQALRNLADRTNVPDLRAFVFTVIQAEAYGLPIAQILRVQAAELRDKRRQRAEEQAMKVPVKIIFPLLFCIFPSLFIVLLGPAAIRIYRTMIGS